MTRCGQTAHWKIYTVKANFKPAKYIKYPKILSIIARLKARLENPDNLKLEASINFFFTSIVIKARGRYCGDKNQDSLLRTNMRYEATRGGIPL